jgi:hypothetical protein
MSTPVWGLLSKSLVDAETIEEAIVRLITAHNNDEEAHLGEGQALQSHKASEIIDHAALSIVTDKIKDFNITPELFASLANWRTFECKFESVDNWDFFTGSGASYSTALGYVHLILPATSGSYVSMVGSGLMPSSGKKVIFNAQLMFWGPNIEAGNFTLYAGCGSTIVDYGCPGLYFKFINGVAYACHRYYSGGSYVEHCTEIDFWPEEQIDYNFTIKYFPGEKIEYYLDGELILTKTENLPPTDSYFDPIFYFRFVNNSADYKHLDVIVPSFSYELS